jgi:hypothetical protein
MPDGAPEELRPWYGRALTLFIALICAATGAMVAWREGARQFLLLVPWLGLMTLACWATFWRPCVTVSSSGVRLVNVLRRIDVPWPAIQLVETKWALTLVTAVGTFRSWAAPAPGARMANRSMSRGLGPELRTLPAADEHASAVAVDRAYDGLRPGDLPETPSGAAATKVREQWRQLREAGHLDDPRLERDTATIRWHVGTIVAAGALLGAAIAASVVG